MDETPGVDPDVAAVEAWRAAEPVEVTCSTCGHLTSVMPHPEQEVTDPATGETRPHEQRWQCDCRVSYFIDPREPAVKQPTKPSGLCDCAAPNVTEGAPGLPGEGAFNPAASAVSHGDLVEAAGRRLSDAEVEAIVAERGGVIHKLDLNGGAEPSGEATIT